MKVKQVMFREAVRVGGSERSSLDSGVFSVVLDKELRALVIQKLSGTAYEKTPTIVPLENVRYLYVEEADINSGRKKLSPS